LSGGAALASDRAVFLPIEMPGWKASPAHHFDRTTPPKRMSILQREAKEGQSSVFLTGKWAEMAE
jgi:hypothetical protein